MKKRNERYTRIVPKIGGIERLPGAGWQTHVAIIDSGLNRHNRALWDRVEDYKDFSVVDGDCDDNHPGHHGTCVARTITHVAPGVRLLVARVGIDEERFPPNARNIMGAVEWAVSKGAKLINLSIGAHQKECVGSCLVCLTVAAAANYGTGVIVAAGNDGPELNSLHCPGRTCEALSVGAVGASKTLMDFSGRGAVGQRKPDILAPCRIEFEDGTVFNGTSAAAPITTGIIACLASQYNPLTVIDALRVSAVNCSLPEHDQGYGLLNVSRALEVLESGRVAREAKGQ